MGFFSSVQESASSAYEYISTSLLGSETSPVIARSAYAVSEWVPSWRGLQAQRSNDEAIFSSCEQESTRLPRSARDDNTRRHCEQDKRSAVAASQSRHTSTRVSKTSKWKLLFTGLLGILGTVDAQGTGIPDMHITIGEDFDYKADVSNIFGDVNATLQSVLLFDGSPLPDGLYLNSANFPSIDNTRSVVIENKQAYFGDGDGGVFLVDFDSSPRFISRFDPQSFDHAAFDIKARNSQVFVADWRADFSVYNFLNSTNPELLSEVSTSAASYGIDISGDYVYLATGSGLYFIDVSNSAEPKVEGHYPSGYAFGDVIAHGQYAIGSHTQDGIFFLDVADKSSPQLLYTETYVDAPANGVGASLHIHSTSLYVATSHAGLLIYDIQNINSPVLVNTVNKYAYTTLTSFDNVLVSACAGDGVVLSTLAAPVSPKPVAQFITPGSADSVDVQWPIIAVADGANGGTFFNMSQFNFHGIASEGLRGFYAAQVNATDAGQGVKFNFLVSENMLVKFEKPTYSFKLSEQISDLSAKFSVNDLFGFLGFYCSLSFMPVEVQYQNKFQVHSVPNVASVSSVTEALAVVTRGNLVFVADLLKRISIVDISSPRYPVVTSVISTPSSAYDISVNNNILIAVLGSAGIGIYDVSNVYNPEELIIHKGSVDYARHMAVKDSIVYSDDGTRLDITDVSDNQNPAAVGVIDIDGTLLIDGVVQDLEVVGDLLIVSGNDILSFYDIKNSTSPILQSSLDKMTYSIVQHGAYTIAGGENEICVFDISYVSSPYQIYCHQTDFISKSLVVSGTTLFAAGKGKVMVFDIQDINQFVLLDTFDKDGKGNDIEVSNSALVVADGNGGLKIIDFSDFYYELTGTPTAADAGNYDFVVRGTNDMRRSAEFNWQLRIEGAPVWQEALADQVAFVGTPYSGVIPQDAVTDPNGDAVYFTATVPSFITFSSSGNSAGTASSSDVNTYTVDVTAHDGNEGEATTSFQMTVTHKPIVVNQIPTLLFDVNRSSNYTVPANTFLEQDNEAMVLSAEQSNGQPLPSSVVFDASANTFVVSSSSAQTVSVSLAATEPHGGAVSDVFDMVIEHFPVIQQSISNRVLGIGLEFDVQFPSPFVTDEDDDTIATRVEVVNADNTLSAVPSWMSYVESEKRLVGVAQAETNPAISLRVTATDFQGGSDTTDFTVTLDHFPVITRKIPDQILDLDQPWQYQIQSGDITDEDHEDNELVTAATQEDGSELPEGIDYIPANRTFVGSRNTTLDTKVKFTVADPLGGSDESVFNLVAERYPTVEQQPGNVVASIGDGFIYELPESTFNDPDGILTYRAYQVVPINQRLQQIQQNSNDNNIELRPLPNWLTFVESRMQFRGTATPTDEGDMTLRVVATDDKGAEVFVDFTLSATYVPKFIRRIDDMTARVGRLFNQTLSIASLIENQSGRNTWLEFVNRQGHALKAWLSYNNATGILSGTPNGTDATLNIIQAFAKDSIASSMTEFNLLVQANSPPELVNRMSDQKAEVEKETQFTVSRETFRDANGDPLSIEARNGDGGKLEDFIKFNPTTLTFTIKPKRGDTNTLSDREYNILLIASDGEGRAENVFKLSVTGASTLTLLLEYGSLASLVTAALFIFFKKRKLISERLSCLTKAADETWVVGEEQELEFSKRTTHLMVYDALHKKKVPFETYFTGIEFNSKTSKITGTPIAGDIGKATILAYNHFGMLGRNFKLNISSVDDAVESGVSVEKTQAVTPASEDPAADPSEIEMVVMNGGQDVTDSPAPEDDEPLVPPSPAEPRRPGSR